MSSSSTPSIEVIGHAIVSADGMIANQQGTIPPALIVDADQDAFQRALDASALVILGRKGHQLHSAKGRKRLVVTSQVKTLAPDTNVENAMFWNPSGISFEGALDALGVRKGSIAVTGGQSVFALFLPHYTKFILAEAHHVIVPGGLECFSGAHPRAILARAGLQPQQTRSLTDDNSVTETEWF